MSLRTYSEPAHAFGNASTATVPLVAAIPGRTVGLHKLILTASAATNVTIQDSSGAALSQLIPLTGSKALVLDENDNGDPFFTTATGLGIQIAQSGTANIGFDAYYTGGPYPAGAPGGGPAGGGGGAGTTPVTWDPATVTAVTLSGGNLVAANTGTTSPDQGAHVVTTAAKNSGKYYFEVTWTTVLSSGGNLGIGIGTISSTYTSMGNGGTTGIENYRGGSYYSNGVQVSAGTGAYAQGTVACVAADLDNRSFWTRTNAGGNWNGSGTANPATNTGGYAIPAGAMIPFATFGGSSGVAGNVITANFGASAFVGAAPSGFTAGWLV